MFRLSAGAHTAQLLFIVFIIIIMNGVYFKKILGFTVDIGLNNREICRGYENYPLRFSLLLAALLRTALPTHFVGHIVFGKFHLNFPTFSSLILAVNSL